MTSEQEALRNRIVQFYLNNCSKGKKYTLTHFQEENIAKSTIYSILNAYESRKTTKRKVGSGHKTKYFESKRNKNLIKKFNHSDKMSQRKCARKIGCSQMCISNALKKQGIKCYKKIKSPEYSDDQQKLVKKQCRWMSRNYSNKMFILDDEKYFTLTGSNMPGNDIFYSSDKSLTPDKVKMKFKHKFEKKVLLYIAISKNGISKAYFRNSGNAINQYVYQNDCIDGILVPFIKKFHSDTNYIFWLDKARAHYAKSTQMHLHNLKIPFVPICKNPTNLPQCRPVEDFFGYLAQMVYKDGWQAKNLNVLKNRIRNCIKKIDMNIVQKQLSTISRKLRKCADNGPYSMVH